MPESFLSTLTAKYNEELQQTIRGIIRRRFHAGTPDTSGVVGDISSSIIRAGEPDHEININTEDLAIVEGYYRTRHPDLDTIVHRYKGTGDLSSSINSYGAAVLLLLGESALPKLRALLTEPEFFIRENAAWALSFIGGKECVADFAALVFDYPALILDHPPDSYHKCIYLPDILKRGLGMTPAAFLEQALLTRDRGIQSKAQCVLAFLKREMNNPLRQEFDYANMITSMFTIFGFDGRYPPFEEFLTRVEAKMDP